jgi:hypothetical protein
MKIGTLASVRPAGPRLATGTMRSLIRARPSGMRLAYRQLLTGNHLAGKAMDAYVGGF